ncbi:MAG: hypothetical protein IIU14_06130 [Ruminococcus sp.]|nr:hypothetical protein [Ruminococcus sp.]
MKHARPDRRFIITKNLIMMLVMLVVIFLASFAWFRANPEATASGLSVKAKSAGGVELALPYKGSYPNGADVPVVSQFSDSIEFENSGFVKGMFKDVTSDGKRFLIPTFESEKNLSQGEKLKQGRKVLTDGTWTRAESSMELLSNEKEEDDNQYQYIALDFYVRSPNKDIKIKEGSYLATASEKANQPRRLVIDSNNSTIYRSNPLYGDGQFSADALAGAIRVSLLTAEVTDQRPISNSENKEDVYLNRTSTPALPSTKWLECNSLGLLWLPRPDMFLQTETTSAAWRLKTGSAFVSGNYATEKKTNHHIFYAADPDTIQVDATTGIEKGGKGVEKKEYVQGGNTTPDCFIATELNNARISQNNANYTPTLQSEKTISAYSDNLVTFTEADPQDSNQTITKQMYLYKYRLNIWIEGCDAEARRAMDQGEFQLYMVFGN